MFQSVWTIGIAMILTVNLIVFYVIKTNPIKPAFQLLQDIFSKKVFFFHFVALFSVLLLNKIELQVEAMLKNPDDFTPIIHQFEGEMVYMLQQLFQNEHLTFILTYFYVVVFTSLMISSFLIYYYEEDFKSFYALFYGIIINYMIAIPFYLFFPVYEVWHFDSRVQFLIPEVYPNFESEYRLLSGLNNCFPSLHTSLSLTMAIIAIRSDNIRFGRIALACAITIIFSIFYLGIHWVSDAVAGTSLALFASTFAYKLYEYNASSLPLHYSSNKKATDIA